VAQVPGRGWRPDGRIAVLRCLGATPNEVVVLYLVQVLVLALVAS
jgi:predicted lysophospholipase L1 biosynthesis ABC-type transport system permease subunit